MKQKFYLLMTLLSMTAILACNDNDKQIEPTPNGSPEDTTTQTPGSNPVQTPPSDYDNLPEKQEYIVKGGKEIALTIDENMLYIWLPQETYKSLQEQRKNAGEPEVLYHNHLYRSCTNMFDSLIDEELLDYKNYVETLIYKDEIAKCDSTIVVAPAYIDTQGDTVFVHNQIYVKLKDENTDLELLKTAAKKYEAYIGKASLNSYFLICYGNNRKLSPVSVSNYLIESNLFELVEISVLTEHIKL